LRLSAIVAMDRAGLIGDDAGLPWHLPRDLRRFRASTLGKPVLMGRKTFQLIGRPLAGRCNIVLTRDPAWSAPGCRVAHSFDEALTAAGDYLAASGDDEVVVAGGAGVYAEAAARCGRLYLTVVDGSFPGTVRFPVDQFGSFVWPPARAEACAPDERNRYRHWFALLERATPAQDTPASTALRLADILAAVPNLRAQG
jgi:dihydrofolate reductase